MTIGTDPHWDIARRLGKDLPHYDERILLTDQMGALENQRLLFGGRQLEDGYSLARITSVITQHCIPSAEFQAPDGKIMSKPWGASVTRASKGSDFGLASKVELKR